MKKSQMKKPLVLGVGNSWRGDDGVGPVVVDTLRHQRAKNFETLCVAGDPLELLDLWEDRSLVVLVDSYCAERGENGIKEWQQIGGVLQLPFVTGGFSSHMFGLAETIELGCSLDRLPPKMLLLALPGDSYQVGKKLSSRAQALVEQAGRRVLEFLKAEGDYA